MMLFYSFALTLVLAATSPLWAWRMLRQGRYREGLRERLGAVPARLAVAVRGRPVVWLHAVSVGELLAATRLLADLQATLPDHVVVVSTTTPTGQRVARERFDVDRVFFFPLDFAFAMRAYLRVLQPRLLVLMESELWPRLLVECERAGVPVAVVNARVSDRSLPRYLALRMLWKPLLQRVTLLLAQSEEDAQRWTAIGAPADRVQCTGNLKFDVGAAAETPLAALLRKHLPPGVPVLVCGSTHPGEEPLLLDCVQSQGHDAMVTILAPRHPERAVEVQGLATDRNLQCLRLGEWRLDPQGVQPGAVVLVDTVGELAGLYALARVAFVGGSLVPRGGQNPLEPVQFGVPVVIGSYFDNFRNVVAAMQQSGVIEVVSAAGLCAALRQGLCAEASAEQQQRASALFQRESGATAKTLAALRTVLRERSR